jgi:hypothetical protein
MMKIMYRSLMVNMPCNVFTMFLETEFCIDLDTIEAALIVQYNDFINLIDVGLD